MLKKVDYEQITKIVETAISANPQPIVQEGASKLEIKLVDKKISEIKKSVEDLRHMRSGKAPIGRETILYTV
ncbi:hypothetical protein DPMN_070519 [Dreissena polymorpha]|uniref:Uncharacterized protein n=1 Tax=Dreissena polymorpha TaxID=45954 RepID=A0A9D4BV60_DREPO|nr:hypothetical protein DPMN_070519 [Dreissena polymorpha]